MRTQTAEEEPGVCVWNAWALLCPRARPLQAWRREERVREDARRMEQMQQWHSMHGRHCDAGEQKQLMSSDRNSGKSFAIVGANDDTADEGSDLDGLGCDGASEAGVGQGDENKPTSTGGKWLFFIGDRRA